MTAHRISITVLGLTVGGLLLAGCAGAATSTAAGGASTTASTTSASGSAVSPGVTLQDTRWGLYWYERRTPTEVLTGTAAVGTEPAIVIAGGTMTLSGTCNGGYGDIVVDSTSLTVSGFSMTEMACADGRGDMEKLLIDTFTGTVGYTLTDDTLTVTGADTTLTFVPITEGGGIPAPTPGPTPTVEEGTVLPSDSTPAPATPIDGTWSLTGYSDPTGEHAVPDGVQPTITLGNGRIGIDTQCNSIGGSLAVADSTLTITEVIGTMMFCEGPRGEMETLLTGTLDGTVGYTLQDGMLEFTGATATLKFEQVMPASAEPTGSPTKTTLDPSAETIPADPVTVPPAG